MTQDSSYQSILSINFEKAARHWWEVLVCDNGPCSHLSVSHNKGDEYNNEEDIIEVFNIRNVFDSNDDEEEGEMQDGEDDRGKHEGSL